MTDEVKRVQGVINSASYYTENWAKAHAKMVTLETRKKELDQEFEQAKYEESQALESMSAWRNL